jgi:hypothetical protein
MKRGIFSFDKENGTLIQCFNRSAFKKQKIWGEKMSKKILYLPEMDYIVSLETYFVLKDRDKELVFETEDGSIIWDSYLKKPDMRFVYNDASLMFRSRIFSFIINRFVFENSVEELINLSVSEFYQLILDYRELTEDKREYPEIVYAEYENSINDSYTKTDEDLIVMKDIIFNTETFKPRLDNVLRKTYEIFREDIYTEPLQEEIKAELAKYQRKLDTDEKQFASDLTVFSGTQSDSFPDQLKVCMLYFASQEYIIMIHSMIVMFGREVPLYVKLLNDENNQDFFVQAISDPVRYKMIKLLANDSYIGPELAEILEFPAADLEKHIGYIQRARILEVSKGENDRVYLQISKNALERRIDELKRDLLEKD